MVHTLEDLEDLLSRPTAADVAALQSLPGDLLILGAAGKMGPSLTHLAQRAAAGKKRIVAAARFTDPSVRQQLTSWGIETITADLLDRQALAALPDCPNVIYMAARKFGTSGSEHLTWALNTYLPALVAERFCHSNIVAFSTGNVYPLTPVTSGGATESTPPAPIGEYAQSALGRERMFEYASSRWGTKLAILRLNYAIDLRYGVLFDIASKVYNQAPIDLRMGYFNAIWQHDANSVCLRAFAHCSSPPKIINVTGVDTISVRAVSIGFARRLGKEPVFQSSESDSALLSNAALCHSLFGPPSVTLDEMLDWTASWISSGGPSHGKPTHFEVRDGKF